MRRKEKKTENLATGKESSKNEKTQSTGWLLWRRSSPRIYYYIICRNMKRRRRDDEENNKQRRRNELAQEKIKIVLPARHSSLATAAAQINKKRKSCKTIETIKSERHHYKHNTPPEYLASSLYTLSFLVHLFSSRHEQEQQTKKEKNGNLPPEL
jgi:hypothetical protein